MNDSEIALINRYNMVLDRLNSYCTEYRRDREEITLIAVSKRHSPSNVGILLKQGQIDFAENYLQEGLAKIEQVAQVLSSTDIKPIWHFIGHIQSRKCKDIAQNFDWVHTIESERVANRLNQYRQDLTPLNVHIQLNLQNEANKSGVDIDQLQLLATLINSLPNLHLRGLMIIPTIESEFDQQRAVFAKCRKALEALNEHNFSLDHLSMGMSGDVEAAITEGATQIRIGTAIFGPRPD